MAVLSILIVPQVTLAAEVACPDGEGTLSCRMYKYLYVCGEPWQAGGPNEVCEIADLVKLADGVINVLLFVVAAPIAVGLITWAGVLYLTSPNKPDNIGKAKKILWTAIQGYVLALVGYVVVKALVLGLIGTNEVATFIKEVFKN